MSVQKGFIAKENVDEKQIEAWKQKYDDVLLVEIGDKEFYLKSPSRKVVSLAMSKGRDKPLMMIDVLFNNCLLGGDQYDRLDIGDVTGLAAKVDEIIGTREAKVKKL